MTDMGPIAAEREIRSPTVRRCERCGRREHWNPRRETWEWCRTDGSEAAATRHCIHEWDVTGSFCPVASDAPDVDRVRTLVTPGRTD